MKIILLTALITIHSISNILYSQDLNSEQIKIIENQLDSLFIINVKAAENFNLKVLTDHVDDHYMTGFISNGRYYSSFDTLMIDFSDGLNRIDSQTIDLDQKKITVLTPNFGIITATGEAEVFLTNGTSFISSFNWTLLYEKIDDVWKIIHTHQSRGRR